MPWAIQTPQRLSSRKPLVCWKFTLEEGKTIYRRFSSQQSSTDTLMASPLLLFLLITAAAFSFSSAEQKTSFIFNQFDATNPIQYIEDASMQSKVIHLTNHSERAIGRAYYEKLVPMKINGSVISFSTSFVFAIVPHPRSGGGDGLCFVMTPTTALNGAIATQYFGLVNTSSDGKDYNHLFAVEFDTIQSIGVEDKDSNHVGIDLNSVKSVVAKFAGYRKGNTLMPINLKSGHNIRAWIDYDGASKQLDISIAAIGLAKPQKALLSRKNLNLDDILEDHMYVGFSASTGDVFTCLFSDMSQLLFSLED